MVVSPAQLQQMIYVAIAPITRLEIIFVWASMRSGDMHCLSYQPKKDKAPASVIPTLADVNAPAYRI